MSVTARRPKAQRSLASSGVVHIAAILLLFLWGRPPRYLPQRLEVESRFTCAAEEPDLLPQIEPRADDSDELALVSMSVNIGAPARAMPMHGERAPEDAARPFERGDDIEVPRGLLGRRGASDRSAMLAKYGGTKESERAVQSALAWLARKQEKNGSWKMNGAWPDSGRWEHRAFATAMAMLAFQADGSAHTRGPFYDNVARGLRALGRLQSPEGSFAGEKRLAQDLGYSHAICTMALCDLYGMTRDGEIKLRAERAIAYCVRSQDPEMGGWRYQPRSGSDTSVTGWVLMGLSMGRAAGLYVPSPVLARAQEYLDSVTNDGATYGYQPGREPTPSMTAEAMLCRQLLGWTADDVRLLAGAKYLLERMPRDDERDLYYWYYGTQALHNLGGDPWRTWNPALRDTLVASQEMSGPETGSWHPRDPYPDRWNSYGGRLYTTCLSTYILETYYRHLPPCERSEALSRADHAVAPKPTVPFLERR